MSSEPFNLFCLVFWGFLSIFFFGGGGSQTRHLHVKTNSYVQTTVSSPLQQLIPSHCDNSTNFRETQCKHSATIRCRKVVPLPLTQGGSAQTIITDPEVKNSHWEFKWQWIAVIIVLTYLYIIFQWMLFVWNWRPRSQFWNFRQVHRPTDDRSPSHYSYGII